MPIHKVYEDWTPVGEPYVRGPRTYQHLTKDCNHVEAIVYDKLPSKPPYPIASYKSTLGFYPDGYITVFVGDTSPFDEYFKSQPSCHYNRFFGWHVYCGQPLPIVPAGLTTTQVLWSEVANEEADELLSETALRQVVDGKTYPPSASQYVGEIGERLELQVTIKRVLDIDNGRFGTKQFFVFVDAAGNEFTWNTSAKKPWGEGESMLIRGTVSGRHVYKGAPQTELQRVMKRN